MLFYYLPASVSDEKFSVIPENLSFKLRFSQIFFLYHTFFSSWIPVKWVLGLLLLSYKSWGFCFVFEYFFLSLQNGYFLVSSFSITAYFLCPINLAVELAQWNFHFGYCIFQFLSFSLCSSSCLYFFEEISHLSVPSKSVCFYLLEHFYSYFFLKSLLDKSIGVGICYLFFLINWSVLSSCGRLFWTVFGTIWVLHCETVFCLNPIANVGIFVLVGNQSG